MNTEVHARQSTTECSTSRTQSRIVSIVSIRLDTHRCLFRQVSTLHCHFSTSIHEGFSLDNDAFRYGGFVVHPTQPHLLVSILEDHTKPAPADVVNRLVSVNTKTAHVSTLAEGADFYAFPSISPDGARLAFVQWHHPNMPWEATELLAVDILASEDGISLNGKITHVSGAAEESASQPLWLTTDLLVFLTDKSGFYNPWTFDASVGTTVPILKTPLAADFGEPDWSLGDYRIAALSSTTLVVAPIVNSKTQLSTLDITTGAITPIETPYVSVKRLKRVSEKEVVFVSAQEAVSPALVSLKLENGTPTFSVLKETSDLSSRFSGELISPEVSIALPNPDSANPLHVLLASPKNPDYDPKGKGDGEKPPCIIMVHGGPTSRTPPGLAWLSQFFTSRGWAL